jgi:hypothetical protein
MPRLQIRITLDDVEPLVWRRVELIDTLTFWQLHKIIQRAMGWDDCHLHEFELSAPRTVVGTQSNDGLDERPVLPERSTTLAGLLQRRRTFRYGYDFGDGWWHTLKIEKRLPDAPQALAAALLDGENACPPEDCGGPWGYAELIAALRDPLHPDHGDAAAWAGGFDPCHFDLPATAKRVRSAVRVIRRVK